MYKLEILPEEIWLKNKRYKKERAVNYFEIYSEVLEFCEQEGFMYLFDRKQQKTSEDKITKNKGSGSFRRVS